MKKRIIILLITTSAFLYNCQEEESYLSNEDLLGIWHKDLGPYGGEQDLRMEIQLEFMLNNKMEYREVLHSLDGDSINGYFSYSLADFLVENDSVQLINIKTFCNNNETLYTNKAELDRCSINTYTSKQAVQIKNDSLILYAPYNPCDLNALSSQHCNSFIIFTRQ